MTILCLPACLFLNLLAPLICGKSAFVSPGIVWVNALLGNKVVFMRFPSFIILIKVFQFTKYCTSIICIS